MAKIDVEYAAMLSEIILIGKQFVDEEEVVRRQIPHYTFRHDINEGFPLVSIAEVNVENIIHKIISFFESNKKHLSEKFTNYEMYYRNNYYPLFDFLTIIGDIDDNGEIVYEYHFTKLVISAWIPDHLLFAGLFSKMIEAMLGLKISFIQIDFKAPMILESKLEEIEETLRKNPMLHDNCQVSVPIYLTSENESIEWKIDRLSIEDFTIINYPYSNK